MAFTHSNEKVGLQCLAHYDWKLDIAIDHYFQNPDRFSQHSSSSMYSRPSVDRRKIEQLFLRYKGKKIMHKQEKLNWYWQILLIILL